MMRRRALSLFVNPREAPALTVALGAVAVTVLVGCSAFGQDPGRQCRSLAQTSPDLALDHCNRAIQSGSASDREAASLRVDRGNAWLAKKEYDRAIADYNQAIRSGRLSTANLSIAHNNRGGAWNDKKDYDRAIADYDTAIRLNAAHPAAYGNRGDAWAHKKDYERAIADYDQAIRLDPSDAVAHRSRGLAWRNTGDLDRAIADYDHAVRLNPSYTAAYYNRGDAWYDKKDYDRAIADYGEAIRLAPNSASPYNDRAAALVEKREYERALADYEKAADIDPTLTRHYSLGITYFYLGRLAQSAAALERAVRAPPHDTYAMLWRYVVRSRAGATDAARELGESAAWVKDRSWPAPVIDFYLGRIDEQALFAAARDPNPKRTGELVCEASFYAAEALLITGMTTRAVPLLRAAARECPTSFVEAHGAQAELKRAGER